MEAGGTWEAVGNVCRVYIYPCRAIQEDTQSVRQKLRRNPSISCREVCFYVRPVPFHLCPTPFLSSQESSRQHRHAFQRLTWLLAELHAMKRIGIYHLILT